MRDQILLNMQVSKFSELLDQVLSSHHDTVVLITGGSLPLLMPKVWMHTMLSSNRVIDGALDEKRRTEEHLSRERRRLGSSILSANELQLGRPRRIPDSNSPPCSLGLGLMEGATRLTAYRIERFCNLAHRGRNERLRNGVNNSSGLGSHGGEAAHEHKQAMDRRCVRR